MPTNPTNPLSRLPIGTVINSYGEGARGKGLAKWALRRAFASIRQYQRRKYPQAFRTSAIHSVIKVAEPDYILSVTTPRAVIERFEPAPGHRYSMWCWKHLDRLTPEAHRNLRGYAYLLEHTPYDYGQLLDIQVKQWFGWLPQKLSVFDLGRSRKVCSVSCHGALVAAWQAMDSLPRPLGEQLIETTCPADFENSPDFFRLALILP